MLDILAIILIIILSPAALIAAFIGPVIILGIIYFIVAVIAEGIKRIIKMFKEELKE